jgi:hypothetical protein
MSAHAATPLVAAAKQRHELTRARAIQAIRELDRAGAAVTFTAVAGQAQVSRSWLYSQPDICRQIREATSRSTTAPIPASQRASDTSLLRRLETAHAENRRLSDQCTQLRAENARLRRQIAHLLGEQRQAGAHARNPPPEPPDNTIRQRSSPQTGTPPHCHSHVQVTVHNRKPRSQP